MFLRFTSSFFCVALLVLSSAFARDASMVVDVQKDREIVRLLLPAKNKVTVFTLPDPLRLVVDTQSLENPRALRLPDTYKGRGIKAVRAGVFNPETTRIVFELAEGVMVKQRVTPNASGTTVRLTLTSLPSAKSSAKNTASRKEKQKEKEAARQKGRKKAMEEVDEDMPALIPPPVPEKPMVIIDAGHGGEDPGAIGPKGTREKDLTLAFARALRKSLLETGRYRVKLTRDGDYFILLRKRVEIARKAGGDIFISLHADSNPDLAARGLSVYTISEQASDKATEALAERENRVDMLGGRDLSGESEEVADILISLAQRDTRNKSAQLADILVKYLDRTQVRLLVNTHRFAGFAVLKAPDTPSVLIEIGFLTNPAEEKMLASNDYRSQMMKGIINGIDAYFTLQKSLYSEQ